MKGFNNFETNIPLRIPFKGSQDIEQFNSQAGQDMFALSILDGMSDGIFLDIGCNDPKWINNTFLLEEKYNWKGILIDFADFHVKACIEQRRPDSIYIEGDATKVNYSEALKQLGVNGIIDYMSLDIDGIETLITLKNLPLSEYKIRVITFEHDAYRFGNDIREESRNYLNKMGYLLLCANVKSGGSEYEDWYVHPDLVDMERAMKMNLNGMEWSDIIFKV